MANEGNLIYSLALSPQRIVEIVDATEMRHVGYLNVANIPGADRNDASIYRDTLYFVSDNRGLHVRHSQIPSDVAKNTKTTIYPVFANEGDTLDLTQYSPDAERIVADVGFDKPDYLTINTSNELEIDADAVTETHPVYIPLKAINRIDATETGTFGFYLVIIQQANDSDMA